MSNHIENKVIVITGAASGFGKLLSEKTTAMGAKVVAGDINQEGLEAVIREISSDNGNIVGQATDVVNRDDMRALAKMAIDTYGQIDVMVNNAGVMPLAFYSDHHEAADAWDRCIDINFKGVLNGITAVYDQMITQGRGHVVNLSSIYGNSPVAGGGVYGATKAAVVFLSESLRQESQGKIKVTTIRPTGVPTTSLSEGVINDTAVSGLLGTNAEKFFETIDAAEAGKLDAEYFDQEDIKYFFLDADLLADQIIYAINQPWGVSISDITVRASGDQFMI